MTIRPPRGPLRRALATARAAALALAGLGCVAPGPTAEAPSPVEVRPDAPAEYDFLVAREHELAGRLDEAYAAYQRAAAKDVDSAFLERKLSELSARQGEYARALEHAERAYEIEPDDVDTRMFLASLYRLRRDTASAERVLVDADGEPISPDAALLLFNLYLEGNRLDDALATARVLVDRYPDELRAYVSLATAYERLGRVAEFEATLRDALSRYPENRVAILSALASAREQRGDREGEIAIRREILEAEPDHRQTLLLLAEALIALERADEAIALLEHHAARHYDTEVTLRLAMLYFQAGDYGEAAERLARARADLPEEHEITYFLGVARARLAQVEAARAAFERIPPDHDRYPDARVQLAALAEEAGDFEAALAEVERARAARPLREYDVYLASLRAKAGDLDGAVAFLKGLLEESPEDDDLLYNIGVLYGEARRVDEAIAYMESALEKNPENASALNYVGYTWAERGENLAEAEELIRRALELRPNDGFITDSLGWVYYMRARSLLAEGRVEDAHVLLERAAEELRRAEELTGGDPVISEHLGDVHRLLGEPERAFEYYEQAIGLEPRDSEQPHLRRKHEELRRELGRP